MKKRTHWTKKKKKKSPEDFFFFFFFDLYLKNSVARAKNDPPQKHRKHRR